MAGSKGEGLVMSLKSIKNPAMFLSIMIKLLMAKQSEKPRKDEWLKVFVYKFMLLS